MVPDIFLAGYLHGTYRNSRIWLCPILPLAMTKVGHNKKQLGELLTLILIEFSDIFLEGYGTYQDSRIRLSHILPLAMTEVKYNKKPLGELLTLI